MPFRFNPFTDRLDLTETGNLPTNGIITLTGDSGGAVAGDAFGNVNVFGTTNQIVTTGNPGANRVTWSLPSTIIAPGSLTTTTFLTATLGDITAVEGNFDMPTTTSTTGQITVSGIRFLHDYGANNTFLGGNSGNFTLTVIDAINNVGVGDNTLQSLTTGSSNVAVGLNAGQIITSGICNVGVGQQALGNVTTESFNTAIGFQSLFFSNAVSNTACGYGTLTFLLTGTNNIALGFNAGTAYEGSESGNILIGNIGTIAESNVIRIGVNGAGTGQQNQCFIAGITGATVTGTAVLCATDGQLGTISSSIRYKENINDISDNVSILNLNPIEFNYKNDKSKTKLYGLIAEEVEKEFPYLCFYGENGEPESVKYHELPTLLLLEIKRLQKRIEILEKK